jgi:hypothetical protein
MIIGALMPHFSIPKCVGSWWWCGAAVAVGASGACHTIAMEINGKRQLNQLRVTIPALFGLSVPVMNQLLREPCTSSDSVHR